MGEESSMSPWKRGGGYTSKKILYNKGKKGEWSAKKKGKIISRKESAFALKVDIPLQERREEGEES